ncbi:MAG TPA: translation elongation factor Ts [Candidatus Saccharimonadales bacterium]|nr:translation elongation factor Ts [Candidatus Saccharimonadales bacterium]
MAKINTVAIKKLRDETGAGVMRVKTVLEEVKGDEKKALEILKKEGFEKVAKRQDRVTGQGVVVNYIHHSGKIGVLVEIQTETDFVAKNELTMNLGKEIALQIASMNPKDVKELENQDFIKDPKKKISELVKEVIAKTGENIKIGKFARIEIGK